jgi:exosortase
MEFTCLGAAFWPIWAWYVSRSLDASDEPWGLIALATAAWCLYQNKSDKQSHPSGANPSKLLGLLATAIYIVLFPFAPNLILSLLVIAALWYAMPTGRESQGRAGIAGLLVISLPLIPSLNFYAGYPMRLVTAAGAKLMLSCLGMSVSQQGAMLTVQNKLVAIDAPCSGISMIWAAAYIALLMATVLKLSGKKTLMLGFLTALIVVAGNIIRAATLVMYDTIAGHQADIARLMPEPMMHLGVGLLIFALSGGATVLFALKLQSLSEKQPSPQPGRILNYSIPNWFLAAQPLANYILIPICLVAAAMPFFAHPSRSASTKYCPPQWPTEIAGHALTAVASLPEENAFAKEFPGAMKRFTDGSNAYFVRAVNHETRQLHPSSDCFRGMGYAITFRPITVDQDGNRWNTFLATKDGQSGQSFLVMERLYDRHGQSWTDVSTWYWTAALGQSKGPWWAITMARQATADEAKAAN